MNEPPELADPCDVQAAAQHDAGQGPPGNPRVLSPAERAELYNSAAGVDCPFSTDEPTEAPPDNPFYRESP